MLLLLIYVRVVDMFCKSSAYIYILYAYMFEAALNLCSPDVPGEILIW